MRFSPRYLNQLIEFEVEENSIQFSEQDTEKEGKDYPNGRGKDLTVNWKFYDGFDPKGKFWTDSNSLGMLERNLFKRDGYKLQGGHSNISANYYPVTSGIAMRD